ncbi:retrovirus-related Pol polyprotein from type-1 retrotransposable element R2 [Caerostris extrusa]|uniref:Retrovirus-related Pol polyprotein from type-1 retrotransposable element R2 n=1 Tax=Caerostris extrusa TaxID=172846 RepID=A0AAV4S8Y6_CAEEX|nr:retrovirus-related Pol polyprotein from type-1 retrotransposable element R2 [Caerostris extrusa]
MPITAEESELNLIDSAFKLLLSADEVVSAEALVSLKRTVSKRLKRTITGDDLEDSLFRHYLVDIKAPFDNRVESLDLEYKKKIDKYATTVEELKNQGLQATVIPFIVGSLGSWYPLNDVFLRKFCSKSYINLFKKLCVSDTIKWSRDIYIEHLTGYRQYSEGNQILASQPADCPDM